MEPREEAGSAPARNLETIRPIEPEAAELWACKLLENETAAHKTLTGRTVRWGRGDTGGFWLVPERGATFLLVYTGPPRLEPDVLTEQPCHYLSFSEASQSG